MIYVVLSHYEDGPSIWVRSTREAAEKLVGDLLSQELDGNLADALQQDDPESIESIKALIAEGAPMKANDLWMETQRDYDPDASVEGFEIREGEIDGDSIESPDKI